MALSENMFSPSVVYIPLTDAKAKLASVKVEVGAKVKVGTLVAEKYFGKEKTPVFCSSASCCLSRATRQHPGLAGCRQVPPECSSVAAAGSTPSAAGQSLFVSFRVCGSVCPQAPSRG